MLIIKYNIVNNHISWNNLEMRCGYQNDQKN